MTERINHAVEARKLLGRSIQMSEPDNAEIGADIAALTHATLALVEQQKIANLNALMATTARSVAEGEMFIEDYLDLHKEINPIIVEGLGL